MIDPNAAAFAALAFSGIASAGVVITLVRNGKSVTLANEKAIRNEENAKNELKIEIGHVKTEIGHVKEKLEDKISGLGAITTGLNEMKQHCSGVTGEFSARIKNLEKKK